MFSHLRDKRMWRVMIALAFLFYVVQPSVLADEPEDGDSDNPVTNIRTEWQGKVNVFIEYDLSGDPSDLYTVSLRVKSITDSSFVYVPLNVIGDIGANIRPGKNKRISWRVADEYRAEFEKSDLLFVVAAVAPESAGEGTELYIVGGAAVVGLAVAIAILSSGKTEEPTPSTFPLPPGRPR